MTEANQTLDLNERPEEILQALIRFDTSNPPGNERALVQYVQSLLAGAGIQSSLISQAEERPNLIARLPGSGTAPPLLLYGHADVVSAAGQVWTHPPFAGTIADGCLWGRGAIDMKGGLAMMIAALLRARATRLTLSGDVIFCVVADEESNGEAGAKFLVREHADQFKGVRYALGEVGGFTLHAARRRFYPIMVAEKRWATVRATVRGEGGHGSVPVPGQVAARLARLLRRLDGARFPIHVTPPARMMIGALADGAPLLARPLLRLLTRRPTAALGLRLVPGLSRTFGPMLRNTAAPTIVRAGERHNVLPTEGAVEIDGRLLPGQSLTDYLGELKRVAGPGVELELLGQGDEMGSAPDMGLFGTLRDTLAGLDPGSVPVPMLLSGSTDARHFASLGIQTYGFTPLRLPRDLPFASLFHAPDERVPIDGLRFGTDAITLVLERFGGAQ